MKTILNIAILLSFSTVALAQSPLRSFREGNRLFQNNQYNDAEILFRKGLGADSLDARGRYNLANTLYRQSEYERSAEMFNQLLADRTLTETQKADIFHNLGNAHVRTENYEEGINAYKQALKLRPNDNDTKYNLAYALQRLQQQQSQCQSQCQNNDQDKDQQQQNNQNQNNQQQQQQQQQNQQPEGMRKSDAERMLNAMERQERNTLDRKKKIQTEQRVRTEKNW